MEYREWADSSRVEILFGQITHLNKPNGDEELFVYLAVTTWVFSPVPVRMESSTHKPVYFVIHALKGVEFNYTTQEKLSLAFVIAS